MRHKMGQAVPSDAFFFCFGGISLIIILMQLLTGFFLIFFYMPNPEFALQSIERMSNEITGGALSGICIGGVRPYWLQLCLRT